MSLSAENCLSACIYASKELANWLNKCTQAHLASSTALINTGSAENTGDVERGEAVYVEHDKRRHVGLGLKMKHERIKVSEFVLQAGGNCCKLPLNKLRYCATDSL